MDKRYAFSRIAAEVNAGAMTFPTSAGHAMKLRSELDNPNCQIETAARLIRAEPLLCARIVAMSNAIAFNHSGRNTSDVHTAITRLGFRTVRTLAVAHITRQLASGSGTPGCKAMAEQLWEHTAHVASLAHLIARRVTHVDPEAALFAGIVHAIGGFYLLSLAASAPGLLAGDRTDWLETGRSEVGRAVLGVLNAPANVLEAVEAYWEGYLTIPPRSLGDTLLLADELAPVASPFSLSGSLKPGEDGAPSLDMVIGKETLTAILEDSRSDVESLITGLMA
ncbi:HDOD domain-containing protein [Paludibacterium yongneupense]|uniref:HDOD domain-containing protein n=1 Tax=Paludibacterium yongneupense TaxID=400061 RepID=UPI000423344F|nr:HDOD domain-containing protein [Paludibacterium yongneupense]